MPDSYPAVEQNRAGNQNTVAGLTCYCTDEFRDRWNRGDIDDDFGSLYVVVPTREGDSSRLVDGEVRFHQGMGTSWEGSLADAISAGVLSADFGEGEVIECAATDPATLAKDAANMVALVQEISAITSLAAELSQDELIEKLNDPFFDMATKSAYRIGEALNPDGVSDDRS